MDTTLGLILVLALYLGMGLATVWALQDILTAKWWAWVLVALLWPVFIICFLKGQ